MSKKQLSKTVLLSKNPKDRRCEECPRWLLMCNKIYENSKELPSIEFCPIWNGSYNKDTKLWYYQKATDIINQYMCEIENKINVAVDYIKKDLDLLNISYEKVDDDTFEIDFELNTINREAFQFKIEKRRIDVIVHDDEFLYRHLTSINRMDLFASGYQTMKKEFRKLQLRGFSNKIYLEAYDNIKLDDLIYQFATTYTGFLESINIM